VQHPREHTLENESRLAFKNFIPSNWLIEDIRHDYGLDMIVMVVDEQTVTSNAFFVQIKATDSIPSSSTYVSLSINTKNLLYYETCRFPVLIVYYLKPKNFLYYLIAQKYIKEHLSVNKPNWRNQKTNTIIFTRESRLLKKDKAKNIITEIADNFYFETIIGKKERTQKIIKYCKNLLKRRHKTDMNYTIRMQATLSSFAISNLEKEPDKQYHKALIKERNIFTRLIEDGVNVRCIISPTRLVNRPSALHDKFPMRLNQLLSFVKLLSKKPYLDHCEFVTFPEAKPNQIIFGEDITIDGHKAGMESGFQLTTVTHDHERVAFDIKAFDSLFESTKKQKLESFGMGPFHPNKYSREVLRKIAEEEIEKVLKSFK
jgi:hypothetical protein